MLAALLLTAMSHATPVYSEPLRPQFHFTAKTGWLNDPNGLVYFGGEYHLFFQHNPVGTEWGNMTWGHAVSKDLLHWKQLDEAIRPDAMGTIFSGSAVIDEHRTSGLGAKGKPPMVCFYTSAGNTSPESKGKQFTQCLAYSEDGRTFTKFEGNPVVPHIEGENRDPKVFWYAPGKHWVMALYLDHDVFAVFNSPDMKSWTKTCDVQMPLPGECPDLFELPVDGDASNTRWVFWTASGVYRLGDFDGKRYTSLTTPIRSNFGNTGYAAQTYWNDPKGRRVQIAWLNNASFPGAAWNQQMGIPTELSLHTTPDGPRLATYPVDEVKKLRKQKIAAHSGTTHLHESKSGLYDISASFTTSDAGQLHLKVNGVDIYVDRDAQVLRVLDKTAPLPSGHDHKLRILADRASIEIFLDEGLVYMPIFHLPTDGATQVVWQVEGAQDWKIKKFDVYEMASVWK